MFGFTKKLEALRKSLFEMKCEINALYDPLWRGLDDRLRETNRKFDSRTDVLRREIGQVHERNTERLARLKGVEAEQGRFSEELTMHSGKIYTILARLEAQQKELDDTRARLNKLELAQKDVVRVKQFRYEPPTPYVISSPWEPPKLVDGEKYAGVCRDDDGHWYHLVLVPGELTSAPFEDAKLWAKGGMPTRSEQALLFANLKAEFKDGWYWAGEQDHPSHNAWVQYFVTGSQGTTPKNYHHNARAVRRVPINEL